MKSRRIASFIAASFVAASAALASPAPAKPPAKPPAVRMATSDAALVRSLPGFKNGTAQVNGIDIHYVVGGQGDAVVLLPGWPQTWWEYHKVMPALAKTHRVVSVDLRGMGASGKPADGYDKKTMAADIAALVRHLELDKVDIVGHDIGSMVAYAFAANHPELTRRLVMMDVPHPDPQLATWPLLPGVGQFEDKVGDGSKAYPWWFAYHQVKGLPEQLGADGRIRLEQDWFFHYLTKDERQIDERSRRVYARAYRSTDALRAGNAWYQAFAQDIVDYRAYGNLEMPVLALGGPGFDWLKATLAPKVANLSVVKVDSGHFIPEEIPDVLLEHLGAFLAQGSGKP
uniref:alpha/beta fold hydrolase n=1 Tax=Variovorax sp. GV025 TaxID=3450240 RepID=UPI000D3428A4